MFMINVVQNTCTGDLGSNKEREKYVAMNSKSFYSTSLQISSGCSRQRGLGGQGM
jgi:hypothetical protein